MTTKTFILEWGMGAVLLIFKWLIY